jgi:hypothetical protein
MILPFKKVSLAGVISPQIGKAPADLLTIYAIYEVFSIK